MKTPLSNSESESRAWLPGTGGETRLRLGLFAWRDWGVLWLGILLRWGTSAWVCSRQNRNSSSYHVALLARPFLVTHTSGVVHNCLLLWSLARRTQGC